MSAAGAIVTFSVVWWLFFFMALPFVFTFMLASFPAGLVIYWAWNNSLSILQQWLIMRRMGVKIT